MEKTKYHFRSLNEIMYSQTTSDILFIQPSMLQPIKYNEQSKIVIDFWETMGKHAALLGDIPTEPNHGLFTLAAYMISNKVSVEILDFHILDKIRREKEKEKILTEQDIYEILRLKSAKIIGISVKTVSSRKAMQIAEIARELHPKSLIIMGGFHATFCAQDLLTCSAVDIVVQGEGEETLLALWNCINRGDNWRDIPGISFRQDDMIIENPRETKRMDLDALPYPAYELLCKEAAPLIPRILSARGCVYKCDFCSVSAFFKNKINFRDPIKVVDEIEFLVSKFGVDFVCLGDLTFMADLRKGRKICEEIIHRKLNIHWWCQTTIGRIDKETAILMKEAGCVQIGFGVESGNQEQIDSSSKPISLEKMEAQFKVVIEAGISVQTYWMFGLPYETFTSATSTIDLMKRCIRDGLTDAVHISVCVPYPGTPLHNGEGENGISVVSRDFENYWMNCDELGYGKPVLATPDLSADHIYMFWFLALSTASEEFKSRFKNREGKVHFHPIDGNLNS